MQEASKQDRCPQCRRAVSEDAATCPFCSTALQPTQADPAPANQPEVRISLRDVFPLLDYEGEPLPRSGRPQETQPATVQPAPTNAVAPGWLFGQ